MFEAKASVSTQISWDTFMYIKPNNYKHLVIRIVVYTKTCQQNVAIFTTITSFTVMVYVQCH